MRKLALALITLAAVALSAIPSQAATWPGYLYSAVSADLNKIRYDTTGRPISWRMTVNFTASSDSLYVLGVGSENVSVQNVTASVYCQPLGDPSCTVSDSRTYTYKTTANPRVGRPCVDWGLTPVTGNYDFGNGGIIFLRVKGLGNAGSLDIIATSRAAR